MVETPGGRSTAPIRHDGGEHAPSMDRYIEPTSPACYHLRIAPRSGRKRVAKHHSSYKKYHILTLVSLVLSTPTGVRRGRPDAVLSLFVQRYGRRRLPAVQQWMRDDSPLFRMPYTLQLRRKD